MTDYSAITTLDVVYAVLEGSDRPLTPYEIEAVAGEAGYDVSAWEAADEIEAHLDSFGYESPFIQVGRQKYWLYFEPDNGEQLMTDPSIYHKWMAAVMVLMVAALVWLTLSSASLQIQYDISVSQPVDAAPVPGEVTNPEPPSVSVSPIAIDPAWWASNAVNQINLDTQSVSRSYLSNYYNTCGPAALSMVISFFRSQPGGYGSRVTPADVLREARSQLGFFIPPYNSGLLDFNNLSLIAGLYGLTPQNPGNSGYLLTLEDLLQEVRQGTPAIVGMRYGYSNGLYVPTGGSGIYNHFITVFGTQQVDGVEYLLVLNNHPGKYLVEDANVQPELMSLDQFMLSWLLNDGSEYQNYGHAAFYKPGS